MHTPLCHHAKGEPVDLATIAIKRGISEIGFSEHAPMIRDDWDDWHMQRKHINHYIKAIKNAQTTYPNLSIKYGLEVDYLPGHEDWIRDISKRYHWDYFIGSVHYISDDFDIDNPHKLDCWKTRNINEVWTTYIDRLKMAADSGLFQIIGHADLCKKFGFYPTFDPTALFESFLETARDRSVAIEINTSGLQKKCRQMYPALSILKMASAMGIGLTFGSDAHAPEEVGRDFEAAVAFAKSAGFKHYCRFHQREGEFISLD